MGSNPGGDSFHKIGHAAMQCRPAPIVGAPVVAVAFQVEKIKDKKKDSSGDP